MERREESNLAVLETMRQKQIPLDVNAKDKHGYSVANLAAAAGDDSVLDFFLTHHVDDIDFRIVNDRRETFTHKMCSNWNNLWYKKLFDKFLTLTSTLNEQMGLKDVEGFTPLDYLLPIIDDALSHFLAKHLDTENF